MHNQAFESERELSFWRSSLRSDASLSVLERAYRAVVALLVASGLRGLAGVKTAEIAVLAGTTESTLFRHVKSRDRLVAESVDWCWSVLNERVARRSFENPQVSSTPEQMIR
jgi:AcrR family transcriptional regulator